MTVLADRLKGEQCKLYAALAAPRAAHLHPYFAVIYVQNVGLSNVHVLTQCMVRVGTFTDLESYNSTYLQKRESIIISLQWSATDAHIMMEGRTRNRRSTP